MGFFGTSRFATYDDSDEIIEWEDKIEVISVKDIEIILYPDNDTR